MTTSPKYLCELLRAEIKFCRFEEKPALAASRALSTALCGGQPRATG
jgi:hypothetical protein